jgi:uncharacterized protein
MEKVSFEKIEIDRCNQCNGIWFDMLEHEELKNMRGADLIDNGGPTAKSSAPSKPVNCPACNVPLIGMVVSGQPHIQYEACKVCYGVFFDAGEFKDFSNKTLAESWRALFGK